MNEREESYHRCVHLLLTTENDGIVDRDVEKGKTGERPVNGGSTKEGREVRVVYGNGYNYKNKSQQCNVSAIISYFNGLACCIICR